MITTLRVSAGFDDNLEAASLRIWALDNAILFDKIQVDGTGVGSALYDKLLTMSLRAPLEPYAPWLERESIKYSSSANG